MVLDDHCYFSKEKISERIESFVYIGNYFLGLFTCLFVFFSPVCVVRCRGW